MTRIKFTSVEKKNVESVLFNPMILYVQLLLSFGVKRNYIMYIKFWYYFNVCSQIICIYVYIYIYYIMKKKMYDNNFDKFIWKYYFQIIIKYVQNLFILDAFNIHTMKKKI